MTDGHWLYAATLQAGDRLLNADGTWAEVLAAETVNEPLLAYNLTVEGFHTYFVAANEDAAPVWVHNANCDWTAGPPVSISKRKFGHTFENHGQNATEFITHRASGSGKPVGQFLDDQAAARFIRNHSVVTAAIFP